MTAPVPPLAHLLHRLAPDSGLIPDAELLRRFAEHRDEAAFELLIWRHGGMIWGVCRRVAPDRALAEDAFQAAALALARHAGSIRRAPSVAGWLYRVSYRVALRTRSRREEPAPLSGDRPSVEPDPIEQAAAREVAAVIDAEVSQLPDPFREAFVLCDLEGRSNAEAATVLGCAVGTIESRLTRARQKLRERLARRGLALSAGALAVAAVPGAVHAAAVRTAADPASAPAAVRTLAARAVDVTGRTYLRAAVLALAASAAIGIAIAASSKPPVEPPPAPVEAPKLVAAPVPADGPAPRQLGSSRFRHTGSVFHSAFSSDNKKLATAALGSVSVWEVKTGKLLCRSEKPNTRFHRVGFSPDDKSLYVIVGPTKGGCELITLDAGTAEEKSRVALTNLFYYGGEFSPDGSRLAVYSLQIVGEAILFDTKTAKELARVPAHFVGNGFATDGKSLIVAGGEETVRVFDSTTGKEVGKLEPNKNRPRWAQFISETDVLLAGGNGVERWDLKKNVRVWQTEGLFPQGNGLVLSPDGKRAAHVSSAVILLDAGTGKELIPRKTTQWDCTSARFSPDSKVLAITTSSGTVILRDATTGEILSQSPDPIGAVSGLTFSPDGRTLRAVAGERWVGWDLTKYAPRTEPLAPFVCLSPDGRIGIRPDTFNYPDSDAEFVDPVTGKRIAKLDPPETGETMVISRADHKRGLFSGDGKRFIAFRHTARDSTGQRTELGAAVWDTATGKRIAELPAEKAPFMFVTASHDGKAVAGYVVGKDKVQIQLWETDTGKIRWSYQIGIGLLFAAFTTDGTKLVIQEFYPVQPPIGPGFGQGFAGFRPVATLDASTGKEIGTAKGPDLGLQPTLFATPEFYSATSARTISPDGKTFAISGWDGTIYLWDLATDREKAKFTHPGPVHALAFSPDGKTLAAGSFAVPVLLYDLSARGPKP